MPRKTNIYRITSAGMSEDEHIILQLDTLQLHVAAASFKLYLGQTLRFTMKSSSNLKHALWGMDVLSDSSY